MLRWSGDTFQQYDEIKDEWYEVGDYDHKSSAKYYVVDQINSIELSL
jgi:hypothetical protein